MLARCRQMSWWRCILWTSPWHEKKLSSEHCLMASSIMDVDIFETEAGGTKPEALSWRADVNRPTIQTRPRRKSYDLKRIHKLTAACYVLSINPTISFQTVEMNFWYFLLQTHDGPTTFNELINSTIRCTVHAHRTHGSADIWPYVLDVRAHKHTCERTRAQTHAHTLPTVIGLCLGKP